MTGAGDDARCDANDVAPDRLESALREILWLDAGVDEVDWTDLAELGGRPDVLARLDEVAFDETLWDAGVEEIEEMELAEPEVLDVVSESDEVLLEGGGAEGEWDELDVLDVLGGEVVGEGEEVESETASSVAVEDWMEYQTC